MKAMGPARRLTPSRIPCHPWWLTPPHRGDPITSTAWSETHTASQVTVAATPTIVALTHPVALTVTATDHGHRAALLLVGHLLPRALAALGWVAAATSADCLMDTTPPVVHLLEALTLPVAGLPITLHRTYDSRDTTLGDFGVGWRLDLQSLRVRKEPCPGHWLAARQGQHPDLLRRARGRALRHHHPARRARRGL